MIGTAFFYLATDQWRYDTADEQPSGLTARRRTLRRQDRRPT